MKTCKTCMHWEIDDREDHHSSLEIYDDNFNELPNKDPEVRFCHSPKTLFYERPNGTQIAICDGSMYQGKLATSEHFGCINHEEK